ncbi:MAG TPA: hypothetical protein VE890_11105, partial [Thermoguttaceae bacterium]|nr:hypothetical protein [Thermoguttaceae bacterium]
TGVDWQIDDGQVVWMHGDGDHSYISFYDGTQTTVLSDSGILLPLTGPFNKHMRAIDDGQAVWVEALGEETNVRLFDGTTIYDLGPGIFPTINAGHVAWEGPDPSGGDMEVFLYTPGITTSVVDRHIFYNDSQHDGNQPAADEQDDNAIAPNKEALLPGRKANAANYTNYDKGINGLMIDIAGLADADGLNAADDFTFLVGGNNDPTGWVAAPAPIQIDVRSGDGIRGSDRVTIVFAEGAITNQWLQVTVKATANTGLDTPDIFYYGNAPADAGDQPINTIVNATDEILARNFQRSAVDPAGIDDPYDYNRDGLVDGTDQILARSNQTNPLTMLRLIEAPRKEPISTKSVQLEATAAELAWLREVEQSKQQDRTSKMDRPVATAVDRLLASDWV